MHSNFLGKFYRRTWCSPYWVEFSSRLYMLIRILKFYFSNIFFCKFFDKLSPLISCSQNWFKFNTGVHCYIQITIIVFVFKIFELSGTSLVSKSNVFEIEWTPAHRLLKFLHANFFPRNYLNYDPMILNELKPRYSWVPKARVHSMYSWKTGLCPWGSDLQYANFSLLGWYYNHIYSFKDKKIRRRHWHFEYIY